MKRAVSAVIVLSAAFAAYAAAGCSSEEPTGNRGGTGGTGIPGTGGTGGTAGTATSGGTAGKAAATGGVAGSTGGTTATGGTGATGTGGASAGSTAAGGSGVGGSSGGSAGTGAPAGGGGSGGEPTTGGAGATSNGGSSGIGSSGDGPGGAGTSGAGAGAGGAGGTPGGGFVTCPYTPPADPTMANFTAGTVTRFNDNGAWTWYSDERAVVDAAGGKIIVGSDANGAGRNGAVEVVIYDIASKTVGAPKVLGTLDPDDHNTGAFLVKPDGKYLAFWAGHNQNCNSYWSNHDGTNWAAAKTFSWTSQGCPFENDRQITYNNLWNMTAENKIYNFVRSVGTSPNLLVSSDNGATWTFGGRLSSTPTVGYVAGYYKYWGNGVDRIDFFGTEAHPRDNDNNLWHGYVKGGKSYKSDGTEVDANITDTNAPQVTGFTKVFSTGATSGGKTFNRMWNSDLVRYADGTVAAIGMGRTTVDNDNPDHDYLYFRFDGTAWKTTYLGKAGKKLYGDEQDYVGLGALHPDDPNIIYISSNFDPRDASALSHREIFQGVTCDSGTTFTWTPITFNSTQDNIRPIVPAWNSKNMVLLWFRGTYQTAQIYDEEVVGIVTQNP